MRKVLSCGGGLDSFAMLLLAILRGELPDVCVFVDVGEGDERRDGEDPAEWPGTYRHLREVVIPLCRVFGIEFVWIDSARYPVRNARSLFTWMWARNQIPVSGDKRICTIVAKVERFERWMHERFPGQDVEVWIGFDAAEQSRVKRDPNTGTRNGQQQLFHARRHNRFPLIEAGFCRCWCEALVRACGFPIPRKSACKFCPYGSMSDWQMFARTDPKGFDRTVQLEAKKTKTENGYKLSIKGWEKRKDGTVRAPPLPIYIQGRPRPQRKPCPVCGAAERATKAVGCDYLDEAA